MSAFTSPIAPQIDRFLAHKRGLGFVYRTEERLLRGLDRMAAEAGLSEVILDEPRVRRFVAGGTRGTRSHRLTLVRQLARFLAVEEPMTFVPPKRFLGARRQQPVIRVLSREEAGRFLHACDEMTDSLQYPHRGLVYSALLRALLLTGLRCCEALALKVSDVDLDTGVLVVHRGKFGKSRFVPVADDLAEQLRNYDDKIKTAIGGRCADDAFFPGPDGHTAGTHTSLYNSFRRTLERAGIAHGGRGVGPGLHSLRHSFAVLRLLVWYEQDADLSAKLPLLATYLGHIGLASSQVYLHMTLDFTGEVVRRHEACFDSLITAVVPT